MLIRRPELGIALSQQLGDPIFLDEAEAAGADISNSGHIRRPWALWQLEV